MANTRKRFSVDLLQRVPKTIINYMFLLTRTLFVLVSHFSFLEEPQHVKANKQEEVKIDEDKIVLLWNIHEWSRDQLVDQLKRRINFLDSSDGLKKSKQNEKFP